MIWFRMLVEDEGKFSYRPRRVNTEKIDGKIQAPNHFIELKLMCFRKQMLVNFCWQHFRYVFQVFIAQ